MQKEEKIQNLEWRKYNGFKNDESVRDYNKRVDLYFQFEDCFKEL